MMSKASVEAERELLLQVWRSTYLDGDGHARQEIRDQGVVTEIAQAMDRCDQNIKVTPAQAANIVRLIACHKPFVSNNDRTAYVYLLALMARSGRAPKIRDVEIARYIERVRDDNVPTYTIGQWIQKAFTE
jgi:hypothetical protein